MIPEFPISIWLLIALATSSLILRLLCRTSLVLICRRWLSFALSQFHCYNLYVIPQYNSHLQENQLYRKVSIYIKSLPSLEDSEFVTLYSGDKPGDILVSLDSDRYVLDHFLHAQVIWMYRRYGNGHGHEFVLKIRSKDRKRILLPYIQHIYKVADEIAQRKKGLKIYIKHPSTDGGLNERWRLFPFVHPSSFDTILLDNDVKNKVKSDLELFLKSKQYYQKVGRVWRRSFLLYGGSGTGKSSFAAAMAKFLSYDLYDIDLSKPSDRSDLKMLLLQTTRKSLILIDNLDRYLMGESTGVSLTAVLKFMDGVVSSCPEERIIVFTMNCKYHIDPLLLMPGRVDVNIYFPLCDFNGFKALALSHLGIKEHKLFGQVKSLFQNGSQLSPAEISEIMISNRTSTTRALKTVILTLQSGNDGKKFDRVDRLTNRSGRYQVSDDSEGSGSGSRHSREGANVMREIQKFNGLLRLKNDREDESLDLSVMGG